MKYLATLFFLFICALFIISCKQESKLDAKVSAPADMVYIPAGLLNMGGDNDQADANEYPKHQVKIKPFFMDETEVTNDQFSAFVRATNYITIAEQELDWEEMSKQLPPNTPRPHDSIMAPGALVFMPTDQPVSLKNPQAWWKWTIGADWKHPTGPKSDIKNLSDHPVVHVAWEDAKAYAKWAEKRLPSEAEWEWAARGGKANMVYPWGNESVNEGKAKANFYQGLFPYKNTLKDGYQATAPIKSYPPNEYGLYDMSGNVWEWCEDWFDTGFYKQKVGKVSKASGPLKSHNPSMPFQKERVIRGGSFLCNDEYCSGYRNARRMGSTSDTGLNHTGFRCVKNVPE